MVGGQRRRAVAYVDLVGWVQPGDRVWLNTTAVDLNLGTGGYDLVIMAWGRRPHPGRGHFMKLRYTPLQVRFEAVEARLSPLPRGLDGMPVVVAELHSQLAPVLAGWRWAGGGQPVVYVATDGGALPLAFSKTLEELRRAGWLDRVITTGQSFGGDDEAINTASGLLAARACGARAAVVAMGPGILGSGETLGHSGIEQAWGLLLASQLGGQAVAVARLSSGDLRPRHRGLSHHTAGVLGLLSRPVWLPLPWPRSRRVQQQLDALLVGARSVPVDVPVDQATRWLVQAGVRLESMGRGLRDDPLFFQSGLAAGIRAARLARDGTGGWGTRPEDPAQHRAGGFQAGPGGVHVDPPHASEEDGHGDPP